MAKQVLEANKALVRAHYDAVTNNHDPDAIRAQVGPDFYDHAARTPMNADEVIAHSALLHSTFGDLSAEMEAMIADGDLVAARTLNIGCKPYRAFTQCGWKKRVTWPIRLSSTLDTPPSNQVVSLAFCSTTRVPPHCLG